jgi:hypothetical protein
VESYDLFLIVLLSWPLCWAGYLIFAKNEAGIAKVNSVGDWLVEKNSQYSKEDSFFSKYIFASVLWPFKKLINSTENVEDVFKQGGLRTLGFGYYGIAFGYLIFATVFGFKILLIDKAFNLQGSDFLHVLLLTSPIIAAIYISFSKNKYMVSKVNGINDWIINKQIDYADSDSFKSRFIIAPLLWPFKKLESITRSIEDNSKQGALRVLLYGYYAVALGYLVFILFMFFIIVMISTLVFGFILDAMTHDVDFAIRNLFGKSTDILHSRQKKNIFGDEYTETTDGDGNIVSVSRKKKGFFGDDYVETTDNEGNVLSESRDKKASLFFSDGKDYVETTDNEGNVLSESRDKKASLFFSDGKDYVETTDNEGNVLSESREKKNWFGDKWVEHEKKK